MTYKHYNQAIDEPLPFDSGIQRALYLELCYRADSRGIVRAPQSQLSVLTLFSPRTIAKEFVRLQELELLGKESFGRYKVTFNQPKSEEGSRKLHLRRWLIDTNTNALKDGSISIPENKLEEQPSIFHIAVEKGWLMEEKREGYIAGQNEDGSKRIGYVLSYRIHL